MIISIWGADNQVNYIPLFQYEQHNYGSQSVLSPSMGMLIQGETFQIVGIYSQHLFQKELSFSYPDKYHTIEFLSENRWGRHQMISIFKSASEEPVTGGLHTFQLASVWGYELVSRDNFKFVLGTGIGVSDFGIEMSDGQPLPVIPLPLIRINTHSSWLDTKFDFITGPNFEFVVAPKEKLRLKGDLRIDNFRDSRDLLFKLTSEYRFFSQDDPIGDFAGVAIGIAGDNLAFDLAKEEEIFDYNYYSIFSELDLTLLKFTGGYTFKNREMYREEDKIEFEDGFTFSIQALYQF